MDWSTAFDTALSYRAFLDRLATPVHRARWDAMHAKIALSEGQTTLLSGFVRRMPVLVMAGTWCGDCVNQCTAFDHFATAASVIDLRFIDRDASNEVADALSINGGHRVPAVLFLSEDFAEVARYGERTLVAYRKLAIDQLGPACPTGLVAPSDDATRAVIAEWLDQFERAQLILRLSPKYRTKYGD